MDFLNSIATPVDTPVESIGDGEGLLRWLDQAGLVSDNVLATYRATAVPGELDAAAAQARALREWFRAFVLKHLGKPLKPDALRELEPLNRMLTRDEAFGQVVARGRTRPRPTKGVPPFEWRPQRRWRSPDALLLPIAKAIANVVCTEDFAHIKACEGPACTLLFLDRTRGRARRWCSMAVCGNRAKQAAHRKRAQRHA